MLVELKTSHRTVPYVSIRRPLWSPDSAEETTGKITSAEHCYSLSHFLLTGNRRPLTKWVVFYVKIALCSKQPLWRHGCQGRNVENRSTESDDVRGPCKFIVTMVYRVGQSSSSSLSCVSHLNGEHFEDERVNRFRKTGMLKLILYRSHTTTYNCSSQLSREYFINSSK